ncbi:hypothetical protein EVAR_43472_1 [Eumeta japonica]|uniref:Mariner Mos1 transposase n=1 Tax=Eumeta variegata TaxID=151549 RepID=A0A4C1Z689_EUMVA|nr:hypothetical protein EVAR_43472_1 [Eumeta japonica]
MRSLCGHVVEYSPNSPSSRFRLGEDVSMHLKMICECEREASMLQLPTRCVATVMAKVQLRVVLELAQKYRHDSNTINHIRIFGYEKAVLAVDRTQLTEAQKTNRVIWFNAMLTRFKEAASNLVWDIVTGEEIWIHCYDPKTKQQSTVRV